MRRRSNAPGPNVTTLHRTDRDESTLPAIPASQLIKPALQYIRTTRFDELRFVDLIAHIVGPNPSRDRGRLVRNTLKTKGVTLPILLTEYVRLMDRTFYAAVEAGDYGKRNTQAFLYAAECMALDSAFNLIRWCYASDVDLNPWVQRIDHYEYLSRREQGCKAAELVTLAIRGLFFAAITEDPQRIRVRIKELRRVVDSFL